MAPSIAERRTSQLLPLAAVCLWLLASAGKADGGGLLDDFLQAADQGQCIEGVAYRMIQQEGATQASTIVQAALLALAERGPQQRALGCAGDIAAQAIAAGADPDQVLEATAAGL